MTRESPHAGKTAVVTGGCGGIGQAVCRRLAQEGARVFSADLAPGENHMAGAVKTVDVDVTQERSVQDLMQTVEKQSGQLDILVNAAGIEIEKTIEETNRVSHMVLLKNRIYSILCVYFCSG